MYCKITDVWEPENMDGVAMAGIVIAVEWSRAMDPWTPVVRESPMFEDMAAFENWLPLRARALDRTMPPEQMPPGLAKAVGKPYEVGALCDELAAARSQ